MILSVCLVLCAGALVVVSVKLAMLNCMVKRICSDLSNKLSQNTNTLITISSPDRTAKKLAVLINHELIELRKERLRFQHGDEEVKTAITNIAHDLRTPLTAICGYLDMLEAEEKSEEVERYLAIIGERVEALKELTDDLFDYSIVTSTVNNIELCETNLNRELEKALVAAYGALKEKGIEPEVDICEQQILRQLDAKALKRVFSNILSNVIKYSEGDLKVTLRKTGEITFSNTASHMSPVQAAKLFDRFYTIENARNSTGVGLSVAKLITEKMNGKIFAEYKEPLLNIILKF